MVNVMSPPLKRAAAKAAISKTAANVNGKKKSQGRSPSTRAAAKAKPSTTAKRGRGRSKSSTAANSNLSSDSESEEELERVSLDSLTTSAESEESNESKKKTKKKPAAAKKPATSGSGKKPGRPKSTASPPRSPQRKAGRPHRDAKPFLGSKFMSGAARKLFLESEAESIVFERSAFEPGKTRRPRVAWSAVEIAHLHRGVEKYGEGAWSAIYQDRNLRFHPNRTQVDLKDKWRNLTSYVPYQQHPIRQFVLVNSQHNEILTPAGNQHIFNNRWPRDAAMKVATRGEFYPIDEVTGKPVESIIIHLKEAMDVIGRSERPQIVHVYRGTRTLQRPRSNIPKFEGYTAIWTGKVEKIGEELLIKPTDILSPEEVEMKRKSKKQI